MTPQDQRKLVNEIANGIRYVTDKLSDFGIVRDTSNLIEAANRLAYGLNTDTSKTSTVLEDLIFEKIDPDKKLRKIKPVSVDLNIGLELTLNSSYIYKLPNNEVLDPFEELIVNISLSGIDGENIVYNSWHLDRDISTLGENSTFPHPLYHMQFGGKLMTDNTDFNYGTMLLVDSPRIPVPPLDILLTIDFILSNYYGKYWYELHEDVRYCNALNLSQSLLWRSYYASIHKYIEKQHNELDMCYSILNIPSLK